MFKTDSAYLNNWLSAFGIRVNISISSAIRHLINDSRQIKSGDVFCAVNGTAREGRDFINDALDKNSGLILVETESIEQHGKVEYQANDAGEQIAIIGFHQLNQHLFALAKAFYQAPQEKMTLVGITGTNGKTSTSQIIAKLFEECQQSAAVIGTNGAGQINQLAPIANTTPSATELHQWLTRFAESNIGHVAMEVSSHALSQRRVTSELFDIAVFTNLSRDHLDYHQTMEDYADAKYQLFSHQANQVAIINGDDRYAKQWLDNWPSAQPVIVFGRSDVVRCYPAFVSAQDIKHHHAGISFTLLTDKGRVDINSGLIGDFNVDNLLAAIAVLMVKEYSLAQIASACQSLTPIAGRMESFSAQGKATAVVDYAHTPDALENALVACRQHCKGALWTVFGCGGDRDKGKRPLMGEVAERLSDHIVITNDNPRSESPDLIADDIISGCSSDEKITRMLERQQAVMHALKSAKEQDIVLLAGKGHEDYIEVAGQRLEYNERALVSAYYNNGINQ